MREKVGASHPGREERERRGLEKSLRAGQYCRVGRQGRCGNKEADGGEEEGHLAREPSSGSIHKSFPRRGEAPTAYTKCRVDMEDEESMPTKQGMISGRGLHVFLLIQALCAFLDRHGKFSS